MAKDSETNSLKTRLILAFETYGHDMTRWPQDLQELYALHSEDPVIASAKRDAERIDALLLSAPDTPPLPRMNLPIETKQSSWSLLSGIRQSIELRLHPFFAVIAFMFCSIAGAALAHASSSNISPEIEFLQLSNISEQAKREFPF